MIQIRFSTHCKKQSGRHQPPCRAYGITADLKCYWQAVKNDTIGEIIPDSNRSTHKSTLISKKINLQEAFRPFARGGGTMSWDVKGSALHVEFERGAPARLKSSPTRSDYARGSVLTMEINVEDR
jgi:hypothetical protein